MEVDDWSVAGVRCVQARLPAMQQDVPVALCESREELVWRPNAIADVDLLMYLRAARYYHLSIFACNQECVHGGGSSGCWSKSKLPLGRRQFLQLVKEVVKEFFSKVLIAILSPLAARIGFVRP